MAPFSDLEHGGRSDAACSYFHEDDDDTSSLSSSSCIAPPQRKSSLSSSSDGSSGRSSSSSVSFANNVAVFAVLHINDYSLVERRNAWYSLEEMRLVRQEWKEIVQRMELQQQDNSDVDLIKVDQDVIRGLEGKTVAGKTRRREARSISLGVVLDEQIYQEIDSDDGMADPIMIAMAYHEFTFPLQVQAFEQAQRDAEAIGHAVNEDVQPKKFDFQAVQAKYLATERKSSLYSNQNDSSSAVATNTLADDFLDVHISGSHNNSNQAQGDSIRKRFSSCFLPLTPKRYARRRPRSFMSTTLRQFDV